MNKKVEEDKFNSFKIKYPEDFKIKCLSVFEQDVEVKKLLDEGSLLLGEYLKNAGTKTISVEEFERARKSDNIDSVILKATKIINARLLWDEYFTICYNQFSIGKPVKNLDTIDSENKKR